MKGQRATRRRNLIAAGSVFLTASLLAYVLRVKDLQTASAVAQLVGTIFAIVIGLFPPRSEPPPLPTPANLDRAKAMLADRVLSAWLAEIRARQLDPEPLVVRWRLATHRDFADQALTIALHGPTVAAGRNAGAAPLTREYRTNEVEALVQDYRKLQHRRLLILGEPGMGKTTLAILMLRWLLEHPEPGEPVPVFFSLSDWNLGAESRLDWLTRRLTTAYPQLCAEEFGGSAVPRELLRTRRILPILDGLDELSEKMRPRALASLNRAADDSLILTCRTKEYKGVLDAPRVQPLITGSIICAIPLTPGDIATYIKRCQELVGSWAPQGSWAELYAQLSTYPMGDALTTPLRLWLLRKVYIEPKGDPAELLQLQTPGQIGDHLLDELTPRLIEANRDREGELGQQESPFRPKKTWNADDAQRWLRYLAYFLKQLQPILDRLAEKQRTAANGSKPTERQVSEAVWKQADEATATSQQPNMASLYRPNEELQLNLGWWQLHYAVALRPVKVALGVIAGAVFGLALSPLFAVSCACLGGLLFYYGKEEPEAEPRYANLRLHGRMRKLSKKSWNAFKFTILLGLTAVPIFTVLIGLRTALVVGLTYALVGGVAFTLSDSIATPSIDDDRARTPKSTLATDRAMTVVHFLAVGLTNAVALGLAFGPAVGLAVAVTFALVGGLGTHLELPLPRGQLLHVPFGFSEVGTAWSVFLVVRIRLAIQRKLPFRLSTFLDDCYRLGLLKQDGPYYQFRHSELQLRMASLYEESKDKNRRGSRTAS